MAEVIDLVAGSESPEIEPPLKKRKLDSNSNQAKGANGDIAMIDITNDDESEQDNDDESKIKKKRKKSDSIVSTHAVRKMLKSDPAFNDFQISTEAAGVIAKATELFANDLLSTCLKKKNVNQLEYDDIAAFVDSYDKLSFLSDIIPKRVLLSEAIKAPPTADETHKSATGNHNDANNSINSNTNHNQ